LEKVGDRLGHCKEKEGDIQTPPMMGWAKSKIREKQGAKDQVEKKLGVTKKRLPRGGESTSRPYCREVERAGKKCNELVGGSV